MYSFDVGYLIKKYINRKSDLTDDDSQSEDEDVDNNINIKLNDTQIKELIVKELLSTPDTPRRQYLLQCADWYPNEYCKGRWMAYSQIEHPCSLYWALYDIGNVNVNVLINCNVLIFLI